LKLVIVEVAAQADGAQHQDGPVVQSLPPELATRITINVRGNRVENLLTHGRLRIQVPEGREDGDHFIAAVEVQFHIEDWLGVQPLLAFHRLSHRKFLEDLSWIDQNSCSLERARPTNIPFFARIISTNLRESSFEMSFR